MRVARLDEGRDLLEGNPLYAKNTVLERNSELDVKLGRISLTSRD